MLIEASEHDQRPRFVQGLEDVNPEEVVQQRKCVFTNLTWDLLNVRHVSTHPPRLKTEKEVKKWVFNHGKLVCRYVYITEKHATGQSCGGERRQMSKREVTAFNDNGQLAPVLLGASKKTPPTVLLLSDECEPKGHKRMLSHHEAEANTSKRLQHLPQKARVLTVGDGFCGCGGVSDGARRAGFRVLWGLEKDPLAMEAYRKNFPEALPIEDDAHDFAAKVQRYKHGCDHLHMSCPCGFWSKAQ
jgi:DNA (cytosine-5)-methyltransferase 1